MSALQANAVLRRLGDRVVLRDVSMRLEAGELVLLAGRNGAGKSTLLRCLIGAEGIDAGEVQLGERSLAAWPHRDRAREVAFVPQDTEMAFDFTGRELVTMGRHPHLGRSEPYGEHDRAAVQRALEAVDAVAFAERGVTTLSGGEQRRIAVARALATEAPLLLLDEPTNNLDLEHALQLVQLLRRLADAGRGVLVASHDLNLFGRHCDRVLLLHDGKVLVDSAPAQALSAEHVATVFGVRSQAASGYFPREFLL
ncbi:MAG: ABC transporter ATP-binding protein [Planctomycetota bacterium]